MTTVSNAEDGERLAKAIVNARLAACVQILPRMKSVYIWEGTLQKEPEHLLMIKTLPEKWDELSRFITEHHRYDVPEIAAIDTEKVSEPYLAWIMDIVGLSVN